MAARMKDDGQLLSVKLVRRSDFVKVERAVKNPPAPSAELINLFSSAKAIRSR